MIVVSDLLVRAVFMGLILLSIITGLWNALKIREIHLSMNSRLDQLLQKAMGEAHAAGMYEERERGVEREGRRRLQEREAASVRS